MLLLCDIRANRSRCSFAVLVYLFWESCYVFSARSNCCEFLATDGGNLRSVPQSFLLRTPVLIVPHLRIWKFIQKNTLTHYYKYTINNIYMNCTTVLLSCRKIFMNRAWQYYKLVMNNADHEATKNCAITKLKGSPFVLIKDFFFWHVTQNMFYNLLQKFKCHGYTKYFYIQE